MTALLLSPAPPKPRLSLGNPESWPHSLQMPGICGHHRAAGNARMTPEERLRPHVSAAPRGLSAHRCLILHIPNPHGPLSETALPAAMLFLGRFGEHCAGKWVRRCQAWAQAQTLIKGLRPEGDKAEVLGNDGPRLGGPAHKLPVRSPLLPAKSLTPGDCFAWRLEGSRCGTKKTPHLSALPPPRSPLGVPRPGLGPVL